MAVITKFFSSKQKSKDSTGFKSYVPLFEPFQDWDPPQFGKDQIRLLLLQHHDSQDHVTLLDSKYCPPSSLPPASETSSSSRCKSKCSKKSQSQKTQKSSSSSKGLPNGTAQKETMAPTVKRLDVDMKLVGEMVFGNMDFTKQGPGVKVHALKAPPTLMISEVVVLNMAARECNSETGSLFESINLSSNGIPTIYDARKSGQSTDSGAETGNGGGFSSAAIEVPRCQQTRDLDSGVCGSLTSSGSFATPYGASPGSTSSLMVQRRLHYHTRMSLGSTRSLEDSYSEHTPPRRLRRKLGVVLMFALKEDQEAENAKLEEFIFSHYTLIQRHLSLLKNSIESAVLNRRLHQPIMEAFEQFQQSVYDLYTAPRLSSPVWLSMMAYSESSYRQNLCSQFVQKIMVVSEALDSKETNFFFGSLLTAVLAHHLAWVPTVMPSGNVPSRTYLDKHTAKWLDTIAKSHPYNALWAQLSDLYGGIGDPLLVTRTVIIGKNMSLVQDLVYVLSYFIRCSEVQKDQDGFYDDAWSRPPCDMCLKADGTPAREGTVNGLCPHVNSNQELPPLTESAGTPSQRVISPPATDLEKTAAVPIENGRRYIKNVASTSATTNQGSRDRHHSNGKVQQWISENSLAQSNPSCSSLSTEGCDLDKTPMGSPLPINGRADRQLSLEKRTPTSDPNNSLRSSSEETRDVPVMSLGTISNLFKQGIMEEFDFDDDAAAGKGRYDDTTMSDFDGSLVDSHQFDLFDMANVGSSGTSGNRVILLKVKKETRFKSSSVAETPLAESEGRIPFSPVSDSTCCTGVEFRPTGSASSLFLTQEGKMSPCSTPVTVQGLYSSPTQDKQCVEDDLSVEQPALILNQSESEDKEPSPSHGEDRDEEEEELSEESNQFALYTEMPLPASKPIERSSQVGRSALPLPTYGRDQFGCCSDHYLPDFVLHGTSQKDIKEKVKDDLALTLQCSMLDEEVDEACCIIADTDTWTVEVVKKRRGQDYECEVVCPSQLVLSGLESMRNLYNLQVPSEFCLMHLEDRLQEIYFKSQMLAEFQRSRRDIAHTHDADDLAAVLGFDSSDVFLLKSVMSTFHHPRERSLSQAASFYDY